MNDVTAKGASLEDAVKHATNHLAFSDMFKKRTATLHVSALRTLLEALSRPEPQPSVSREDVARLVYRSDPKRTTATCVRDAYALADQIIALMGGK